MIQKTSNLYSGKIVFLLIFIIFISKNIAGQENEYFSKTFDVKDFSELFLEGSFGIELIQGDKASVEIRAADEKAFSYLKIEERRDMLHLHVERKPFDFSKVNLLITFNDLEKLRIYGGMKLETRGFLDLDDIEILLEGSAKVNLKIKANYIEIDNRGGVLSELSGITETFRARIAGAGSIIAGELQSENAVIRIEGVGTALVNATKTLDASIKGAGKIKYRGNPEVIEKIEGLGAVNPE